MWLFSQWLCLHCVCGVLTVERQSLDRQGAGQSDTAASGLNLCPGWPIRRYKHSPCAGLVRRTGAERRRRDGLGLTLEVGSFHTRRDSAQTPVRPDRVLVLQDAHNLQSVTGASKARRVRVRRHLRMLVEVFAWCVSCWLKVSCPGASISRSCSGKKPRTAVLKWSFFNCQ
jgi:hypothetical protein